jgi:hypothetical protein
MYVQRDIESRSRNRSCSAEAKSITYSWCAFVGLVMWHAKRLRHIVLSYMASLAVHFPTVSHKRQYVSFKKGY